MGTWEGKKDGFPDGSPVGTAEGVRVVDEGEVVVLLRLHTAWRDKVSGGASCQNPKSSVRTTVEMLVTCLSQQLYRRTRRITYQK